MKLCSWLFTPLVFISCAAAQDASKDRHGLGKQPQVYLIHQTANRSFMIESSGYRFGKLFISPMLALAQQGESAALQQKFDLRDPVNRLKESIAETLKWELGLTNLQIQNEASDIPVLPPTPRDRGSRREVPPSAILEEPTAPQSPAFRAYTDETAAPRNPSGPEIIAARPPTFKDKHPTGAVIHLVTRHWGIDNFKMKYFASYRLFDLETGRRLGAGGCRIIFDQVDEKSLPRRAPDRNDPNDVPAGVAEMEEAIFGNNGAVLKASLLKAAELCSDWIAADFITEQRKGPARTK